MKRTTFPRKHDTRIELGHTIHKTPLDLEEIKKKGTKPKKNKAVGHKCFENHCYRHHTSEVGGRGGSAMLEEEARRRKCLHTSTMPPHAGAWGIRQILLVARVAHVRTFLSGTVSPHAPLKCVFRSTNLRGLLCILRCPINFFFSCFGLNMNPRLLYYVESKTKELEE